MYFVMINISILYFSKIYIVLLLYFMIFFYFLLINKKFVKYIYVQIVKLIKNKKIHFNKFMFNIYIPFKIIYILFYIYYTFKYMQNINMWYLNLSF